MNSNTSQQTEESKTIVLLELLCNDDGLKRKEARKTLVKNGTSSLPLVMELLESPKHICRWKLLK